MMPKSGYLLVAAGAICCATLCAQAQQSQGWTSCVNKEKAPPDAQIDGCTGVIQSGKESQSSLATAFNNRGNAYRDKGDNDRAIADYTEAIRLNPKYAYPYNGRGNAYNDKKDYVRAIADYTEAIKIDPAYASPHNGRGNARRSKGERDAA